MVRLLLAACLIAAATLSESTVTTTQLSLSPDGGGHIRKCNWAYGLYGGREDTLSLLADLGVASHDDTSETQDGWCAFHSNRYVGSVHNYSVSVDMYNNKGSNTQSHSGIAFNVVNKCTFDFAYFRPHSTPGCIQLGSMRGCRWTVFAPQMPCADGNPTWDQWYGMRVDVSDDMVSIFKKELNNEAWVHTTSVATSDLFGNHQIARAGLLVAHGVGDKTYFNRFELAYTTGVDAMNRFKLELEGTAAVSQLDDAKHVCMAAFRNISSDLAIRFSAELPELHELPEPGYPMEV